MHYIVLDMEWNQPVCREKTLRKPFPLYGEVVQIGAVKLDDEFQELDAIKLMVAPRFYTKMHHKVAALTHIKTEDLKNGLSFPEAFARLCDFCGDNFVFLTWGSDDIPMLRDNLLLWHLDPAWIPTCYDVQPIYDNQITKESRQHSLSSAMAMVGEPPFDAHDALNDARSTACVCRHLDMIQGMEDYRLLTENRGEPNPGATYPTKADARRDPAVSTFPCQVCHETVVCDKWLLFEPMRQLSVATCTCGTPYFVRLRFHRNTDQTVRVTRHLCVLDEAHLDYFEAKQKEKAEHDRLRKRIKTKARRKRARKPTEESVT